MLEEEARGGFYDSNSLKNFPFFSGFPISIYERLIVPLPNLVILDWGMHHIVITGLCTNLLF